MPIENEKNRCVACGAALVIPVQGGRIKCEYCGAEAVYTPQSLDRQNQLLCPKCGAVNPRGARHCARCGVKLEFECPRCNATNTFGAEFCVQCGINIPQEQERLRQARLEQEAAARAAQEAVRAQALALQQVNRRRTRRTLITLGILFAVFACTAVVAFIIYYQANLSPRARAAYEQQAQAALASGDPRNWMPDAYAVGDNTPLSSSGYQSNDSVADNYGISDLHGRINGYYELYQAPDVCDPSGGIVYYWVQAEVFESDEGAEWKRMYDFAFLSVWGDVVPDTTISEHTGHAIVSEMTLEECDQPQTARMVDYLLRDRNVLFYVKLFTLADSTVLSDEVLIGNARIAVSSMMVNARADIP